MNSDSSTTATNFVLTLVRFRLVILRLIYDGNRRSVVQWVAYTKHGTSPLWCNLSFVGDTTPRVIGGNGSEHLHPRLDVSGGDGEYDFDRDPATCGGRLCLGTGVGVHLGPTDGTTVVEYVYTHHNDAPGIGGAHGRIQNSNCAAFNGARPCVLGMERCRIYWQM